MEYCINTKETKILAHEEDKLERMQYFDGALYYHTGYWARRTKSVVKKIDLATYEVETVFNFNELYTHPQDYEIKSIIPWSLNVTEDKIFIAGIIRMVDSSKSELGAFIYDRNENSIQRLSYNPEIYLMAMSTYVTDDEIFYIRSSEQDGGISIVVLDHNGNDISDRYAGMYVGSEE